MGRRKYVSMFVSMFVPTLTTTYIGLINAYDLRLIKLVSRRHLIDPTRRTYLPPAENPNGTLFTLAK